METIDTIKEIDKQIESNIACLISNIQTKPFGLAKPVNIQDETIISIPAVINNDGECHYVFTDDENALGWYHRLITRNYSKGKGWGDTDSDIQTDEIILIIWGLSSKINMQAETVESKIIIPSLPAKIDPVSSNFDAKSVLSSEFKNFKYLNKPEEFIFSVKYKVSTTFKRKCREIKC